MYDKSALNDDFQSDKFVSTPLSRFKKAKLEAQKIRGEWDTLVYNLSLQTKNGYLLHSLKIAALTIGTVLSLGFLVTLGFTIASPLSGIIALLVILGTLLITSFVMAKIVSNKHQEKLRANSISEVKEPLKKMLDNSRQFKEYFKNLIVRQEKSRWNQARAVMAKGALAEINPDKKTDPTTTILSRIYYDKKRNHKIIKTALTKTLEELSDYQKSPFIAPFMYLLALAAIGKHRRGFSQKATDLRPEQQLTIILVTNYDVAYFFSDTTETTGGFYDNQNGIFISLEEDDMSENFYYSIFHEAAHFAAQEVMENDCKPYQKENNEIKQDYLNVMVKVKAAVQTFDFSNFSDDDIDRLIMKRLQSMFIHYQESNHESELFVIVAETIALLGYEKGLKWLNNYVPDLARFYDERFNPACIQYLKEQRVWDHIEIDPGFAKVLGLSRKETLAENREEFLYHDVFYSADNSANPQVEIFLEGGTSQLAQNDNKIM